MRALHKGDRMQGRMPEMAIIESNTLAMMGLKQFISLFILPCATSANTSVSRSERTVSLLDARQLC